MDERSYDLSFLNPNISRTEQKTFENSFLSQVSLSVKETESSRISHMLEAQKRGESVIVSMGSHKEKPEEFKVIHHHRTKNRRKQEKKRIKEERNISLPVLQQYFPGSLKDAAKSIGVCPTTLKRICREHGIMRWPSRKIKKVGHSLKKLQLVIDSVKGAEGTIQLGSFYTSFPELSSPVSPNPKPKNDSENLYTSQKTASYSSSGSSHCFSKENPLHLKEPVQDETKSLTRTQSVDFESLVPVVKKSSPMIRDEVFYRVKAVYGEEKIWWSMSQHCGLGDLQREIMSRFRIDDMNSITLKYLDDDAEWVLLTCDADLEECMDLHIASKNCTIKLFLDKSLNTEPGTSLTAKGSS